MTLIDQLLTIIVKDSLEHCLNTQYIPLGLKIYVYVLCGHEGISDIQSLLGSKL
jgi:hypothetical protein